ncbi:MAG: VOC family protein [Gemmatimonadaceae bacterium]|nr:VOC family protein [Chitinophagaceae bacterium]
MTKATPFLLFDGKCAEAFRFYQHILGGELTLTKVADTPMREQFPVEKHERIIYAQLKNGAIDISASDWMASPALEPKQGNTTAIYLTSETGAELSPIFKLLAEGAEQDQRTFMELRPMPFGVYGQLTDKFGVSWVFRAEK